MKKELEDTSKPYVHVPPNADINLSNNQKSPPKTKYDYRQFVLDKTELKKITLKD